MSKKRYTKEELLQLGINPDSLEEDSIDYLKEPDSLSDIKELSLNSTSKSVKDVLEDSSKAAALGLLQGATFNFADELLDLSPEQKQELDKIKNREKVIYDVGELVGSFLTPMPGAGLVSKAASAIKSPLARKVVEGAAVGSAAGALSAAGLSGEQKEIEEAAKTGGTFGVALPVISQAATKGVGQLFKLTKSPALLEALTDIFSKAKESSLKQEPVKFGSEEFTKDLNKRLIDETQQFVENISKTASEVKSKKYQKFFDEAKAKGVDINLDDILGVLGKSESKATEKFSDEFKDKLKKIDASNIKELTTDLTLTDELKKLIEKANKKAVKFTEKEKDNLAKDALREAKRIIKDVQKVGSKEEIADKMVDNWLTLEQERIYNSLINSGLTEDLSRLNAGKADINDQLRDIIGESVKNSLTKEIITDPVTGKSKLVVSYTDLSGNVNSKAIPFDENFENVLKSPKDLLKYQKDLAKSIYEDKLSQFQQKSDEVLKKDVRIQSPTVLDVPILEKEVVTRQDFPQRIIEVPNEIPKLPAKVSVDAYSDLINFLNDVANSQVRDLPEKRLASELRAKLKDAVKQASPEETLKLFEEAENFRKLVGQKDPQTNQVRGDFSRVFGHSLDLDEIASRGVDRTGKVTQAAEKLRRDASNKMYNPGNEVVANLEKLGTYIDDLERFGGPEFKKFRDDLRQIQEDLKTRDLTKLLFTGGSELERSVSSNILTDPLAVLKRVSAQGFRAAGDISGAVERKYRSSGAKAVMDQLLANPDALNTITQKLEQEGRSGTAKFLLNMARKYQQNRANTPLGVKSMSQKAADFIVKQSPGLQDTLLDINDLED
ncbi:MAG: hypothetical protein ABIM30_01080 [candidate division WOR-3 bacterium]